MSNRANAAIARRNFWTKGRAVPGPLPCAGCRWC